MLKLNAMINAYSIRSVPRATPSQCATTVVSLGRSTAYTPASTNNRKPTLTQAWDWALRRDRNRKTSSATIEAISRP